MHINEDYDHHEDSYHHTPVEQSLNHDYGATLYANNTAQPSVVINTHQQSSYTGTTSMTPQPIGKGVPQGHLPPSHYTSIPPNNYSSGMNPMSLPYGLPPTTSFNPNVPITSFGSNFPINIPGGGVIVGPPVSFPPGMQIRGENLRPQGYDVVPRSEFEKCVQECHIWQSKYRELNNKYLSLLKEKGGNEGQDSQKLREENDQLEQKILGYQASERQLSVNVQSFLTNLTNKYKESALREAGLLFDRFKLECKAHERSQ